MMTLKTNNNRTTMAVSCPFQECDHIAEKSEDVLPHLKLEHYENFSRESVVKPFGPGHKGILIQGTLNLDQDQPTTVAHTGTDGLVIVTLRKSPSQNESIASIYAFNVFPKSGTKLTSKFMLKNVCTEEKLTFKNKFFDYENSESKHKTHAVEITEEEREKLADDGSIFFHLEYNRKKIVGDIGGQNAAESGIKPVTEVSQQNESIISLKETETDTEVSQPNQNETSVNETEKVTEDIEPNESVTSENGRESEEKKSDENLSPRRKSQEEISTPECEALDEFDEQCEVLDESIEQCEALDESNELSNIKIVEVADIIERNQPSVQCPIEMCGEILPNAKQIIPHIKEDHSDEVSYPSSLVEVPRGVQVEGVLFHPGIHPIVIAETSKCGSILLTVTKAASARVSEPSYNFYMYNVNPNFKVRESSELILKNPHDSEGNIVFRNRLFDYSDGKKKMINKKIIVSEVELNNLMVDDVIIFEINTGDFCQRQMDQNSPPPEILDEEMQIEPDIQIIEDIDEDYDVDGNGSEDSGPVIRPLIQPWPKVMKRKRNVEEMEWQPGPGSVTNKRTVFRPARQQKVKSFAPFGGWTENPEEENNDLKFSNNMKDACRVQCLLCDEICFMVALRGHTRRKHNGMSITEYKEQFGELVPIENIYHRCGICAKVILLDSDSVAKHLKTPGHNITHKHYNMQYMVTRSYS